MPLSDAAVEVLRSVPRNGDLVFESPVKVGKPMSDMTMAKAFEARRRRLRPHGFRTSFRSWLQEQTDAPHAVAEMPLGHRIRSSGERSNSFEKRAKLTTAWAAYLAGDRYERLAPRPA